MSKKLLSTIAKQLEQRYDDPVLVHQYALWILEAITQQDAAHLLSGKEITLTQAQNRVLEQWIHKLVVEHEPLQYLIGWVPFGDLKILVEPPILIPRPETEEWCLKLIEQLKTCRIDRLNILELCSGTGCIALAIAKAFPNATITAVDINQHALALAKKNATLNDIHTVSWIHSDLFAALKQGERYDLVVANPPYISPKAWEQLDPCVRAWEDPTALVAQDEGYAIIARIIQEAHNYLRPNTLMDRCIMGQVWIEIGHDQAQRVSQLYTDAGFARVHVLKDLEGKERVVIGALTHEATP